MMQAKVLCVEIRIDHERMLQEVERELARLIRVERLAMLVERRAGEIPRRCLGWMSWLPSIEVPLLSHAAVMMLVAWRKSELGDEEEFRSEGVNREELQVFQTCALFDVEKFLLMPL